MAKDASRVDVAACDLIVSHTWHYAMFPKLGIDS